MNNKWGKEKAFLTVEYQWINEGRRELENHLVTTITVIIQVITELLKQVGERRGSSHHFKISPTIH